VPSSKRQFCSFKCAKTFLIGEKHPSWTGGRNVDERGYIRVNVGPGRVRHEHRVVMEKLLKRPLRRGEVVHHRDGKKGNNKPSNLQLMKAEAHKSLHANERWHG
jgi:hypothetical protein